MTSANPNKLTLEELADYFVAWWKQTLPDTYLRMLVPAVRELAATGQPVEPQRLATLAGMSLQKTLALLREAPTDWDDGGERVTGLGLTLNPTPHRYETQGHVLWAWCAPDTFLLPVWLGAPARVQSPCAATSDPITFDLTPTRVEHLEPASAVVSIHLPDTDLAHTRQDTCSQQNLYRSAEDAAPWLAEHPQGLVLPVAEAAEVDRRMAVKLWGEKPSRR